MKNSEKIILDLCGGTGAWSRPYKDAGYDVRVITYPDTDVRSYNPPENVYGILAAPPCTMFSIARNDTTAKEKRDMRKGMELVNHCFRIIHDCLYDNYRVGVGLKFWAMENPQSGYLKRFIGNPPFIFDPSEFGDKHTKKTALWGLFNEPKKIIQEIPQMGNDNNYVRNIEKYFADYKYLIPEGYKEKTGLSMRTIVRSITPQGFAKAFFEANQ